MPNRLEVTSSSKNHYFTTVDNGLLGSPYLLLAQITEKDEEVHSGDGSQYLQSHESRSRLTSILDNSDKMESVIFRNQTETLVSNQLSRNPSYKSPQQASRTNELDDHLLNQA